MKLATFTANGQQHFGVIVDGGAISLSNDFPQHQTLKDVVKSGNWAELETVSSKKGITHPDGSFSYDVPIPNPRKIICVGVNFPDRNAEYKDGSSQPKYMSLFPRFASSFVGHNQSLIRPPENHTLDYEGEVVVVIGKGGRRIKAEDAYDHIAAVTLCNEGTIRDWVRHAKFNVTQGKNWDKSGAIGPWLVPFTDPKQLDDARIITRVNGEVRQDDTLDRMIFPVREEIAYISTFTTLEPGDLIITGTPTGAGARFDPPRYLVPGDVVEVEVEGIGSLVNSVADE